VLFGSEVIHKFSKRSESEFAHSAKSLSFMNNDNSLCRYSK